MDEKLVIFCDFWVPKILLKSENFSFAQDYYVVLAREGRVSDRGVLQASEEGRGTLLGHGSSTGNRPGLPIIILSKTQNFIFKKKSEPKKSQNITGFFHPGVNLLLNGYGCA